MRPAARSRAAVCAAALAALLVAGGCSGGAGESAPSGEEPAPPAAGPPPAASAAEPAPAAELASPDSVDHERFQQRATEVLRLMIAAAQRALPIGPMQERIDAARGLATSDVAAAADRLEAVIADLEALLEEGG